MCEEFFNVGILDPSDFDLASFEFGQSEYDNEEPTYPTALSCDPRGASYAEKRSNARGIPTLLSPDYLVSEENDLRSVMVVEVLLNVAPLPDQALGPHSVEAEAYGRKLRGLVYLAFKESNITMPFKMGRHNNGELTNGDLVDFMIELDGRVNTNHRIARQQLEKAVSSRRLSVTETCKRGFLPAPPLDVTLLDWHRLSRRPPGVNACSPPPLGTPSPSRAVTSPLGGRPAYSDQNIAILRHVRLVCLTSGAKGPYAALGYGLYWLGDVPAGNRVPSPATQRYGEMRNQSADELYEARKLNENLIANPYACVSLSTDATGEGGDTRVNLVLKIPSGETGEGNYPITKA